MCFRSESLAVYSWTRARASVREGRGVTGAGERGEEIYGNTRDSARG